MKRPLFVFALFLLSMVSTQAQFGTAHDFTVTDIDGNEIHLYSILDAGKVVVLDVSATWCGPCWNLHNNHYLQQLHEMYGPDGTDQIRVIFYEGDASTGMDALLGTGGNTLGNWTEGVTYPIVNETPLQLSLSVYAPLGFPTVNIIRPSDREIIADVYDQNLAGMEASINTIITLGETTNVREVAANSAAISIFPNPVQNQLVVDLSNASQELNYLQVTDATGRLLKQVAIANQMRMEVSLEELKAGFYFVQLLGENGIYATKKIVKEQIIRSERNTKVRSDRTFIPCTGVGTNSQRNSDPDQSVHSRYYRCERHRRYFQKQRPAVYPADFLHQPSTLFSPSRNAYSWKSPPS